MLPTMIPSVAPTTTIPSSLPTITGEIASVSISGTITEEFSKEDISSISSQVADIYGVDESDIDLAVDYVSSGTLNVTIPEDVSEEDAITDLEESISDVLGVHSSDVVVTIGEDGTVTYSVSGSSYENAVAILNATSEDSFGSELDSELLESGSDITVDSVTSDDSVDVVITGMLLFKSQKLKFVRLCELL